MPLLVGALVLCFLLLLFTRSGSGARTFLWVSTLALCAAVGFQAMQIRNTLGPGAGWEEVLSGMAQAAANPLFAIFGN